MCDVHFGDRLAMRRSVNYGEQERLSHPQISLNQAQIGRWQNGPFPSNSQLTLRDVCFLLASSEICVYLFPLTLLYQQPYQTLIIGQFRCGEPRG